MMMMMTMMMMMVMVIRTLVMVMISELTKPTLNSLMGRSMPCSGGGLLKTKALSM